MIFFSNLWLELVNTIESLLIISKKINQYEEWRIFYFLKKLRWKINSFLVLKDLSYHFCHSIYNKNNF